VVRGGDAIRCCSNFIQLHCHVFSLR
jgi:hypothetical protein